MSPPHFFKTSRPPILQQPEDTLLKKSPRSIAAIPAARALVKGDLLESWTRKDPEAAAAFISEELATNPGYQTQNTEALSVIAASRPEFTAQWLQTLPAGNIQTNAAVALAANWSNFDRPATEAWIAQLPPGPIKEAAARSLTTPPN
jgi:hypothetical protein